MRPLVTAVLLGCSSASMAGVVMQMEKRDLDDAQAKPTPQIFYFQDGAMRSEGRAADEVTVFRDQSLYLLDTRQKSFRRIDKAQVQQLGDQLAGMRQKLEQQLSSLPPEQRAMIEQAMGKVGVSGTATAPAITVRDTGRSETAAGYGCRVWEILSEGRKAHEVCAAPPGSFPAGTEMLNSMRAIGDFAGGLASQVGGNAAAVGGYWTQLQQINGVPLLARDYDAQGKAESEMRVVSVKSENLGAGLFTVPTGYTEKKLPNLSLGGN